MTIDHSLQSEPADAQLLFYLSAGAALGCRGVRYVCRRLCSGVPEPCPLSGSAGDPLGGWVGGTGRWEGEWGGR